MASNKLEILHIIHKRIIVLKNRKCLRKSEKVRENEINSGI
jgi:hypothetical protein